MMLGATVEVALAGAASGGGGVDSKSWDRQILDNKPR